VIISIFAFLLAIVALVLAVMALMRGSEAEETLRMLKNELADAKQKLDTTIKKAGRPATRSLSDPPPEVLSPPSRQHETPPRQREVQPPRPPPSPPAPVRPPPEEKFINFDCAFCGQNIDAPESMASVKITCPSCFGPLLVPEKITAPPRLSGSASDLAAMAEEASKASTVRIDTSQMLAEAAHEKPKRQIIIKRTH